jgi:hypothetical protein
LAVWLGDRFPEGTPPGVESVERAVAHVRGLFDLSDLAAAGTEPVTRIGHGERLRVAS